jgi:uncharacterized lipoprotein YmbA
MSSQKPCLGASKHKIEENKYMGLSSTLKLNCARAVINYRPLYSVLSLVSLSLLLGLLQGCQSSPQKQYYVLTTANEQPLLKLETEQAGINTTELKQTIGVGPVEIPEYLHLSQILYQAEDGSLQRMANSYWAEPLTQGIARVISLNLSQGDTSRNLILFPWRADNRPRYSVNIKLLSLNINASQTQRVAKLVANWELKDTNNINYLAREHFSATINAQPDAPGLTQAYSALLAQLTEQIGAQIEAQVEVELATK